MPKVTWFALSLPETERNLIKNLNRFCLIVPYHHPLTQSITMDCVVSIKFIKMEDSGMMGGGGAGKPGRGSGGGGSSLPSGGGKQFSCAPDDVPSGDDQVPHLFEVAYIRHCRLDNVVMAEWRASLECGSKAEFLGRFDFLQYMDENQFVTVIYMQRLSYNLSLLRRMISG